MSEKVVYLLGAGFSAYRGIPTLRSFYSKSKDMYQDQRDKFSEFTEIFNELDNITKVSNYYQSDVSNIEETLSILEMESQIDGKDLHNKYLKYITKVINYYTPSIKPYGNNWPGTWPEYIFGSEEIWRRYGYFLGSLLNLKVIRNSNPKDSSAFVYSPLEEPKFEYSIVSLN